MHLQFECLSAAEKDALHQRVLHVLEHVGIGVGSAVVMDLLAEAGARVEYADPHVPALMLRGLERKSFPLADAATSRFDLAVVLVGGTEWPLTELDDASVPVFDAVNAGGGGGRLRRLGGRGARSRLDGHLPAQPA